MRKLLLKVFGLYLITISLLAPSLWSAPLDEGLKKAHNLMFMTHRSNADLAKALAIYEELIKKTTIKEAPPELLLEYSYALYYKADYTFPKEGTPGYKAAESKRKELFDKASEFLDSLLDDEDRLKNTEQTVQLYFIAGMVKAELAAITSSPFLIIKGRKLLEKALKIDKNFNRGAIYLGLGRMYARTPRILFGSRDKSLEFLAHALKDFTPPSIVGFYFQMDTLLDGKKLQKLYFIDKKNILQAALDALNWEVKRRSLPPSHKDFLTPEEGDAVNNIKNYLKEWSYSTNPKELTSQIAKLK